MLGKRQSELLLFGLATLVLTIDQIAKALVLRYLPLQVPWNPIAFLRPLVTLTHVTNTGAAFGLFPDGGFFFAIIAVIVIGAILVYYRRFPADQPLVSISLGLQLGGALGNLLDRLQHGKVTDFIEFHFWPVFNIADSSVFIGVVVLAYYLLFMADKQPERVGELEGHSP